MIDSIFAAKTTAIVAERAVAGLVLSAAVAGIAWRSGSLSRNGMLAAAACGTLCVAAGWGWGSVLILYFLAASALSRVGSEAKDDRTRAVVAKGGARDAIQVLANGGVYSALAVFAANAGTPMLTWGAIAALAAASSDTWATEIGVGLGGTPRSIVKWTYVRPGESGGITGAGLVGSAAGAAWIGLIAIVAGFPRGVAIAALFAGIGGSLVDSVLGATLQERRRCGVCNEPTERIVHVCGSTTHRVGGIAGLNNDAVNLLSTVAGLLLGIMAFLLVQLWSAIGR
ncbi:MAG: DUF92 domain-containing protein [Gemmatimonadaceae bacterium]